MPLYDYKCLHCGNVSEHHYPMSSFPQTVRCECGSRAIKVCNAGGFQVAYGRAGGILDDHPPWIADTREVLQDPEWIATKQVAPLESRSQLKRYMKEKGLVFKDECGPIRKPVEKPLSERARRRGAEAVAKARQKDRSITLGTLKG